MRVYVITQGNYSDYHICGVTLDINAAENMVKHLTTDDGWYSEAKIEKYDTDIWDSNNAVWRYYMRSDGTDNAEIDFYAEASTFKCLNKVKKLKYHHSCEYRYDVYLRAPDKDHALKIGRDLVAEYKARKEGIAE